MKCVKKYSDYNAFRGGPVREHELGLEPEHSFAGKFKHKFKFRFKFKFKYKFKHKFKFTGSPKSVILDKNSGMGEKPGFFPNGPILQLQEKAGFFSSNHFFVLYTVRYNQKIFFRLRNGLQIFGPLDRNQVFSKKLGFFYEEICEHFRPGTFFPLTFFEQCSIFWCCLRNKLRAFAKSHRNKLRASALRGRARIRI